MELVQRFALDNIYRAPGQDKQFSFKMVRLTKRNFPARRIFVAYGTVKHLPTQTASYHVFALGNMPPAIMNLLKQKADWFRDSWINAAADMVVRKYILKVYNQQGVMYPRERVYYSFIDESSLLVAIESAVDLAPFYDVKSMEYLSVYSNSYFNGPDYNSLPVKVGIDYRFTQVQDNLQKLKLQEYEAGYRTKGGDVFTYVNGLHVKDIRLDIPDGSFVEMVYDQSVLSCEEFEISKLRTYASELDSRVKLMLYRDRVASHIQYMDDTELYVSTSRQVLNQGLYFYKHKEHVVRNVTDKDFGVDSVYISNTRFWLMDLVKPGVESPKIVLYTRRSGRDMPLVYSSMKLHELYKLPADKQLDVIDNTGYTLEHFRAEKMEASNYFKVASAGKMTNVTKELASDTVGYNGVTYYFANTPNLVTKPEVDVPELYQTQSVVFEHDTQGLLTGHYSSSGSLYPVSSPSTKFTQFFNGYVPNYFPGLEEPQATVTLLHPDQEYVVLSAYFTGQTRQSPWVNITNSTKATKLGSTLTLNEDLDKKVKIVYLNQLHVHQEAVSLNSGVLYFPITQIVRVGENGSANEICDVPYRNVAVYLNKRRLTHGIDYKLAFPYICIFSKKYIDYTLPTQEVLIRCSGCANDFNHTNELDVTGFVNNGVLTRNRYYDIRDDRVMAAYVDGLIKDRAALSYSEEDSTVRLDHPYNGLPYTLEENFISVKAITGVETAALYDKNVQTNKSISLLFNQILPEPQINEFNIIAQSHPLYSTTLSKMINDIVTGVIPADLYSNPYNDSTIINLLNTNYKQLLELDPVKLEFPSNLTVIHPHLGNAPISVNLLAYRFITNTIRLITNNKPEKINLSGYLAIDT